MVSLISVFTLFVVLFGVIGAMRGWAKELLVTSAVVLGLFLNAILETYVESYRSALFMQTGSTQFLIRGGFLVLLAFFGYQTPSVRILRDKVAREHLQDMLLGMVLGVVNGYLLMGSIWFYLHHSGYPTDLVIQPAVDSGLAQQIADMVAYLPPAVLPVPHVYFAVGVVFVFIIVVFV